MICHQIQEHANKNTLHQLVLNKASLLLVCCIKEDLKSRITIEIETLVSSVAQLFISHFLSPFQFCNNSTNVIIDMHRTDFCNYLLMLDNCTITIKMVYILIILFILVLATTSMRVAIAFFCLGLWMVECVQEKVNISDIIQIQVHILL